MAYDLAWSFNLNQVPVQDTLQHQCQNTLFALKTGLLSAGWTVVSSSDSSTSGASDLWVTSANLVWANASTARSWILLASPVGFVAGPDGSYTGAQSKMYFCIECQASSGTLYYNGQFTTYSTSPTGGTTTAIPTGGNGSSTGVMQWFSNTTLIAGKCHFAYTSNGGWYFGMSNNGANLVASLISFMPLVDVNLYGSNPYPYAAIFGAISSSANYDITFFTQSGVQKAYNYDGTIGTISIQYFNGIGNNVTATGDINGVLPMTPGYVLTSTANKCFFIGRIPDLLCWQGGGITIGSTSPGTGTPEYSLVSTRLWIPTNAALNL